MDLQGRAPQPSMRPDNTPTQRPQQYANASSSRPSIDGMSPPPAQQPMSPPPTPQGHQSNQNQPVFNEQTPPAQPQVLEPIHHSSSKPVILAIITLLIAGGLAVAAFFAFRPETADKINKVNSPSPAQSQTTKPSTSESIDSATTDINKQVDSLNDTQDFSDTDLSDQALGL